MEQSSCSKRERSIELLKQLGDIKGLWGQAVHASREKLKAYIESMESTNIEIDGLMGCFCSSSPLVGLETEHMQLKYYKDNFNLLVS